MAGAGARALFVLLLVAAIILRSAALFLFAVLVGLVALATWLGERYCLSGLLYSRRFGVRRAFWGEEVAVDSRVTNAKVLPVPWLHVLDEVPQGLVPPGVGRASPNAGRACLEMFFALGWYERVTRRHHLRCVVRGDHVLGPARLEAGDVFGFYSRTEDRRQLDRLVVYPRLVPVLTPRAPAARPQGDFLARRFLIEDPGRVAGVRDYAPGDPLRLVHWKATARSGRLQVRRAEPVAALQLALFVNVDTHGRAWDGFSPNLLELVVMTAAGLAREAAGKGYEVGVYTNSCVPGTGRPVRAPAGRSPQQLREILTALARANPPGSRPVAETILGEVRRLRWGASAVLVTSYLAPAAVAALDELRRRGHPAGVVVVAPRGAAPGTRAAPGVLAAQAPPAASAEEMAAAIRRARAAGLRVWWVREGGDWREVAQIRIEAEA